MTVSKRTLFRPTALAHYGNPTTANADGNDAVGTGRGFWATLWLVLSLMGGVLAAPLASRRRKRVPIVLQMTTTQCGAACLTMVLNYYGRATTLAETSTQMDIGRDGATALTIAQAARHYGLRVRAYTGEPQMLAGVTLPAILHWNFSHFVVLEQWDQNGAIIVDPAAGRRPVAPAEFDRSFTGVLLTLEPETTFRRQGATRSRAAWQQQLHRLLIGSGAWRAGVKALLATVAVQVTALAFPLLTKLMVDQVVPQRQIGFVPVLAAGIGVVVLMQMIMGYLRRLVLIRLQADVDTGLMAGFLEHLLALPYRFYQQRTSGDLLMRLSSNTMMRELLTTQTISALMDGVLVITFLAVLLVQAPSFGLVTLGVGLVQILLLLASTSRMHDLAQRHLSTQAETHAYLVEALAGINVVKATGAEERVLQRWTTLHHKALAVTLEKQRLSALLETLLSGLQTGAPLLLLLLGAQQVLAGSLSLGAMLALNALALGFLTPLDSLVSSAQQLQSVGAHLARLTDVLEAEREPSGGVEPTLTGQITLDKVSYHYDRHSAPVLQEISVQIQPGQKVAIVGRSGSGKSTLARLLLGLHEPTAGEIRFDGTPLAALDRRALRRQLGVVLQEVFLFSGSIRQNLTFGLNDLSVEQMVEATRLACIDRDIAHMPMDFETMVAEGGAGLSGGQRQRLALARALARTPAILLLDEATSHLDTTTEQQIEQHLRNLGCTQVVIAHRLSTVRNADLILVLENGRIVEQGNHDELLTLGGLYAELVCSEPQ
ncbi:MAG: peptidase domain-containing ABC transporter [Caldilineaceae bacterium]